MPRTVFSRRLWRFHHGSRRLARKTSDSSHRVVRSSLSVEYHDKGMDFYQSQDLPASDQPSQTESRSVKIPNRPSRGGLIESLWSVFSRLVRYRQVTARTETRTIGQLPQPDLDNGSSDRPSHGSDGRIALEEQTSDRAIAQALSGPMNTTPSFPRWGCCECR
jgi:hypothetical protein